MPSKLNQEFANLYREQAHAIVAHDLAEVAKLHAKNFTAIPLNGRTYSESDWKRDCAHDMSIVQYKLTTYEIRKISEVTRDSAVVYATRRCAGIRKRDKADFNTAIDLRDVWVKEGASWRLKTSETISRELRLNGQRIIIKEIGKYSAMVQGCGDEYGEPV
jgi:hypothetical protein